MGVVTVGAFLLAARLLSEGPAPTPVAGIEALLAAGDLDGAIRAGEAAVSREPRNSVAWDLLGRAVGLKAKESPLLEQMRLARRARACFDKAVTLDPSNVAARADLATYDMRAPAFLGGGKEKARRQIEEVRKLDPVRGHELAGALAEREKDPARAEAEYRLALSAEPPGDRRARSALSALLVRQRRFADAGRLWREALDRDPTDPLAAWELAGVALESGEGLEEARRGLEACLASPRDPAGVSREALRKRLALVAEELEKRPG
jgi:tetratricopeptide (TPR) repeat protein